MAPKGGRMSEKDRALRNALSPIVEKLRRDELNILKTLIEERQKKEDGYQPLPLDVGANGC